MHSQKAETQLLALLRGEHVEEFDLLVTVKAGHWFVSLSSPDVLGPPGVGEGKNFAAGLLTGTA